MSTERKTPVALVHGDRERLGQALVQTAVHDLGHLVGPHLLAGHPVQRLRRRPVATQADLQEPVAAQRARLDQATHRLAVAPQRPELDVAGVRVRVEVDHRDPAVAEHVRHALGVGEGDRVVAAEDDRDRARTGHLLDRRLERGQRHLDVAGVHLDVAGVHDVEVDEPVRPQRQAGPGAVMREVVRASGSPSGRTAHPAGARCRRRTVRRG